MNTLMHILVFLALLGSGLIAGVLYAFSGSVMAALARISSQEGIRAMQLINRIIINPLFIGSFIGTAFVSACLVLSGALGHLGDGTVWFMTASLFYLSGTFLVTVFDNVPMNEKLDAIAPASGDDYWQHYLRKWTRLNHFRTLCAITASALFAIGILLN